MLIARLIASQLIACAPQVPCVLQHRILQDDRIFIVKKKWLELILARIKFYEIRDKPLKGLIGKRIYLCESATSTVYGYACVEDSIGPLDTKEKWDALRDGHRVPGGALYKKSYALKLSGARRMKSPVQIRRNRDEIAIRSHKDEWFK